SRKKVRLQWNCSAMSHRKQYVGRRSCRKSGRHRIAVSYIALADPKGHRTSCRLFRLEPVVPVQLASVDVHHFTAHPGGTVRREEEDDVGDLLRLSSPVKRLIGIKHLAPAACIAETLFGTLHVDAAPALGFHGAWVHANHPNAVVDAAAPERLGKSV